MIHPAPAPAPAVEPQSPVAGVSSDAITVEQEHLTSAIAQMDSPNAARGQAAASRLPRVRAKRGRDGATGSVSAQTLSTAEAACEGRRAANNAHAKKSNTNKCFAAYEQPFLLKRADDAEADYKSLEAEVFSVAPPQVLEDFVLRRRLPTLQERRERAEAELQELQRTVDTAKPQWTGLPRERERLKLACQQVARLESEIAGLRGAYAQHLRRSRAAPSPGPGVPLAAAACDREPQEHWP